jgi:broad specificity phosphatase PhoE
MTFVQMQSNCSTPAPIQAPSHREIYLVRHGETAWSLTGQHTGRTDLPLTVGGEGQALRLKERLAALTFEHVVSSSLQRARRTAELAGFGASIVIDPELAEWNYGDYEGRTSADIRRSRPEWDLFRDGCPGGESVAEITERVDAIAFRLHMLPGHVLIFSSGHVLRVLAARWLQAPTALGRGLALDPACVSVLGYDHAESDRVIRLWNDGQRDHRGASFERRTPADSVATIGKGWCGNESD